ncbi:MAG: hypothetical protein EXR79_01775 [Myxococcales bacterium]|nr:hypothetical protein [Myxococcales bacterium]
MPDPVIELAPAPLAPAVSMTVLEFEGIAAEHTSHRGRPAEFTLELRPLAAPASEGPAALPVVPHASPALGNGPGLIAPPVPTGLVPEPTALGYRIGFGRRLPVRPGELVRLQLYQRMRPDGAIAKGLIVRARSATDDDELPRLVAVIDTGGALPREKLPEALRGIQTTESIVYHVADRTAADCDVATAHLHFAIADNGAKARTRQLAAPGARLRLFDTLIWDVALLDNRRTVSTTCGVGPPAWTSWAALATAPVPDPDLPPPPPIVH